MTKETLLKSFETASPVQKTKIKSSWEKTYDGETFPEPTKSEPTKEVKSKKVKSDGNK